MGGKFEATAHVSHFLENADFANGGMADFGTGVGQLEVSNSAVASKLRDQEEDEEKEEEEEEEGSLFPSDCARTETFFECSARAILCYSLMFLVALILFLFLVLNHVLFISVRCFWTT